MIQYSAFRTIHTCFCSQFSRIILCTFVRGFVQSWKFSSISHGTGLWALPSDNNISKILKYFTRVIYSQFNALDSWHAGVVKCKRPEYGNYGTWSRRCHTVPTIGDKELAWHDLKRIKIWRKFKIFLQQLCFHI